MTNLRLLILLVSILTLLVVLVIGSVYLALGDSFRRLREERRLRNGGHVRPVRPRQRGGFRFTPERTRLRWYSPELIAVLLLSLAAGLWLVRLLS